MSGGWVCHRRCIGTGMASLGVLCRFLTVAVGVTSPAHVARQAGTASRGRDSQLRLRNAAEIGYMSAGDPEANPVLERGRLNRAS